MRDRDEQLLQGRGLHGRASGLDRGAQRAQVRGRLPGPRSSTTQLRVQGRNLKPSASVEGVFQAFSGVLGGV